MNITRGPVETLHHDHRSSLSRFAAYCDLCQNDIAEVVVSQSDFHGPHPRQPLFVSYYVQLIHWYDDGWSFYTPLGSFTSGADAEASVTDLHRMIYHVN